MKKLIISLILCFGLSPLFGQSFPEGIAYQAQVFSQTGGLLSDVNVDVRFNIREGSLTGAIVWQEDHTVLLNELGHFATVIGEGTSTGGGSASSFDAINWSSNSHFLEMLVDEEMDGSFVSSITQQMMSVPFAFHAKTTDQQYALSELTDVDTTGVQVGDILKWDGTNWVPGVDEVGDCDTVNYALYADSTAYADTATYAANCIVPTMVDSAGFAFYSDTANFAQTGLTALYADSAVYADTAGVALYAINNWGIDGNDNTDGSTNFLGTIDSVDLIIKSYDTERMRIKANGKIGVGTSTPDADFEVENVDGVLFTGDFGAGTIPESGAGTRMMFYPKKGAFRAGTVTGTQWDDGFIGNYSFASGYNTRASGEYSTAFGYLTNVSGEGAFGAGWNAVASGDYSFAVGQNASATGENAIAIGRAPLAHANGGIAIGYHPQVDADYGMALGFYAHVTEQYGMAMGYRAKCNHQGSFIFSDQSTPLANTNTNAVNQFMVKASGGSIFYTSSDLSTGVELLPGSGAWSILSDRNSKENITELDASSFLDRLDHIDVYEWNYIAQSDSIRHIGPMAQDFYSAFQIGTDPTRINSGDFAGINLLLIKALHEKSLELEGQKEQLSDLQKELELLRNQREKLELRLDEIEELISKEGVEDTSEK